uniref:Ferlin_C domain-containing protein n=1 Tax=Macrostomum lignano TaxID=282301 RepID=A0A1I8INS1_9PLAT
YFYTANLFTSPRRPETSFLWFTSPWKTFKHIVWKNYKWYILGAFLVVIFGLLLAMFIYAVPGLAARKVMGV